MNGLIYRDRRDAGRILAESLLKYEGLGAVVMAIPRGGVPVGAEVARRLGADLDIVVARKIGAPTEPELALGAVTANGGLFLNDEIVRALSISAEDLESLVARERAQARSREKKFRDGRPPTEVAGRIVLLVDDGLATGATMRASVRCLRKRRPARLIVAVPVGSQEACDALRREADEVVCPSVPDFFGAVGFFYQDFEATEDAEVLEILREFSAHPAAPARVEA